MTLRPPIYPSDFVPAPLDRVPGETEAQRVDRLGREFDARVRAAVARFAKLSQASTVAPKHKTGEACAANLPTIINEPPPARFYDLGPWRE